MSLVAGPALAQDPRFGARGQTVLTTRATAGLAYSTLESNDAKYFTTSLGPSFDYFVWPRVSLGVDANGFFQWSGGTAPDAHYGGASLTLRGGIDVPLGRWVSLWPELQIALGWSDFAGGGHAETDVGPTATLFVPLLFHLRSRFFVGFGPSIAHTIVAIRSDGASFDTDRTNVTLGTILGGYTGGENSPTDDDEPSHWRAFGEEGETALAGSATFGWLTDQRFGGSTVSLGGSASVDHFFLSSASLGLALSGGYTRTETPKAAGGASVAEQANAFVEPRFGYILPISERFSFYPKVGVGFGVATSPATSFTIDADLEARVLWHFAPHFSSDSARRWPSSSSPRTRAVSLWRAPRRSAPRSRWAAGSERPAAAARCRASLVPLEEG